MASEQEQFLKSLDDHKEQEVDLMQQPLEGTDSGNTDTGTDDGKQGDVDIEEVPDDIKNRRHRRLEMKLQQEREANIAMAARMAALAEARRAQQEADPAEYVKQVERIYGTNSPEAIEATSLLTNALKAVEDRATERALETFRQEQREAQEEQRKEEQRLDSMLEEIEDEYNVDLSSARSAEMRKGFFKYLERVSPKDADGNVKEYADHIAVWEEYQSRLKKPVNPAKQLSSRSMTASGSSSGSSTKPLEDATTRYLSEQGII